MVPYVVEPDMIPVRDTIYQCFGSSDFPRLQIYLLLSRNTATERVTVLHLRHATSGIKVGVFGFVFFFFFFGGGGGGGGDCFCFPLVICLRLNNHGRPNSLYKLFFLKTFIKHL